MTATAIRTFVLLSTLFLALVTTDCQKGTPDPGAATDESAAGETTAAPAPAPTSTEGVGYEPAYPEEVSAEGLGHEDVAQQEAGHAHDGEEHSQGEKSHTHDEDDSDDDHDH